MLNVGFQLALYTGLGPYTDRNYQTGFPKNELTVSDVEEFDQNAFFGQKVYPNYRIAGRYKINENTSVKFAGLQIYQFIHSLTNNTKASQIYTWRISTNHLQPGVYTSLYWGFKTTNNQAIELVLKAFTKDK